jgi:hypothetical protein
MQLITHQSNLDALPGSSIKAHIQARYDQLSEDIDVPSQYCARRIRLNQND